MTKITRKSEVRPKGEMETGGSELKNEISPALWLMIIIGGVLFLFTMGCGVCQALGWTL